MGCGLNKNQTNDQAQLKNKQINQNQQNLDQEKILSNDGQVILQKPEINQNQGTQQEITNKYKKQLVDPKSKRNQEQIQTRNKQLNDNKQSSQSTISKSDQNQEINQNLFSFAKPNIQVNINNKLSGSVTVGQQITQDQQPPIQCNVQLFFGSSAKEERLKDQQKKEMIEKIQDYSLVIHLSPQDDQNDLLKILNQMKGANKKGLENEFGLFNFILNVLNLKFETLQSGKSLFILLQEKSDILKSKYKKIENLMLKTSDNLMDQKLTGQATITSSKSIRDIFLRGKVVIEDLFSEFLFKYDMSYSDKFFESLSQLIYQYLKQEFQENNQNLHEDFEEYFPEFIFCPLQLLNSLNMELKFQDNQILDSTTFKKQISLANNLVQQLRSYLTSQPQNVINILETLRDQFNSECKLYLATPQFYLKISVNIENMSDIVFD